MDSDAKRELVIATQAFRAALKSRGDIRNLIDDVLLGAARKVGLDIAQAKQFVLSSTKEAKILANDLHQKLVNAEDDK